MRKVGRQLLVPATIALLAIGVGVTYAASDDAAITACGSNALVRLVEPGEECRKNERALTWNVMGPKGDPGEKGDPGPKGDQGPPGLTGLEQVSGEAKRLPTGVFSPNVTVAVTCPEGKVALSGGATLNSTGGFIVTGSPVTPAGGSMPTGWTAFVTTASGGALPMSANVVATAFAICAKAE